jgi:hypothetical protein
VLGRASRTEDECFVPLIIIRILSRRQGRKRKMLVCSVRGLRPFHVLGVAVTPMFGRLDLDYPELDGAEFAAATAAMPAGAATSSHQGVIVSAPPGHSLRPHFHAVPQYQVFYKGSGRVGRHEVRPVSVHYADPFTPYGPIVAGEAGLAYAVLRPRQDDGANWMPEDRAAVMPGPRRRFTVVLDPDGPNAPDPGSSVEVVGPDGDHAAAVIWHRLSAGDVLTVPPMDPVGDTTTLVGLIAGSLEESPATAPAFGHVGEAPARVRAGGEGADVLLLITPREGRVQPEAVR